VKGEVAGGGGAGRAGIINKDATMSDVPPAADEDIVTGGGTFSVGHLANVLTALYPSRAKMRDFVIFMRERVKNEEFKSVTFSGKINGKRTEHSSQQMALQTVECKLEGVTNGEEFLRWLVSSICLCIGLSTIRWSHFCVRS